jgi:putative ABC transport system permease protein
VLKWIPLVWANLTRRRLRTVLTIISVAASFTLFGLLESFRYSVTTFADDYSNALVVQSRNVRLPYSHVTRLLGMPGVESACGYLVGFVELAQKKRLMLQAVPDRDLFAAHPGISVAPAALERWHQDRLTALIDADLAAENSWKVGDRVMLPATQRGLRFRRADGVNALEVVIAGIFSSSNALASGRIFVRYDYVRDVVGADRAGLEFIAVRFSPALNVDRIRASIDAEFANSEAPVKTYSYRALLRSYYATFRDVSRLAVVVLAVSFVTLLLIAGSVLIQAQRERSRELAVVQALGVSRMRLVGMLLAEAATIVVPAAMLGLAAAAVLIPHLPAEVRSLSRSTLPVHTILTAAVLTVGLSVTISIVPCLRMWRMPLAAGLARE